MTEYVKSYWKCKKSIQIFTFYPRLNLKFSTLKYVYDIQSLDY